MAWRVAVLGEDVKTGRRLMACREEGSSWAWIESTEGRSERIEFSVENLSWVLDGLSYQAGSECFFSASRAQGGYTLFAFKMADDSTPSHAKISDEELRLRLDELQTNGAHRSAELF